MTTNEPKGKEKGKQVKRESESEDEDGSLVFSDMVRVKVKKDHREDHGTVTASWDVMPLVITSKAASVELGWKGHVRERSAVFSRKLLRYWGVC
jgi:hypothetical protein